MCQGMQAALPNCQHLAYILTLTSNEISLTKDIAPPLVCYTAPVSATLGAR